MQYRGRPQGEGQKDDVLGLEKMRRQVEIMRVELGTGTGRSSAAEDAYRSALRSAARGSALLDRLAKKRDGETRKAR